MLLVQFMLVEERRSFNRSEGGQIINIASYFPSKEYKKSSGRTFLLCYKRHVMAQLYKQLRFPPGTSVATVLYLCSLVSLGSDLCGIPTFPISTS